MRFIQKSESEIMHYIMTFAGGFIGLYAICAHGNYGSAQTGNLMNMVIDFAGRNTFDFAVRAGALFLFCMGITVSWMLNRFFTLPMRELCLVVDAAGLALSALMPEDIYPFLRLYPLFVATSFQWGTFNGVGEYKSASLFLTGNLKSCLLHWLEYLTDRKREMLVGARIYTITILSYLAGGYMGCMAVRQSGAKGAFYGYLPLAIAEMILLGEHICERKEIRSNTMTGAGKV